MENEDKKQYSIMNDEKYMEFLVDQFEGIRKELRLEFKQEIGKVTNTMVTKSFFTDGIADLKGDLVVKLRKEDSKVNLLADILQDKKVIQEKDVKRLKEIEVFPLM